MQLPSSLAMHPVDLLFGATIPQVQCYMVCGPARNLELQELRDVLTRLVTSSAPRLCYEMPRSMGMIRTLRLSADPAGPVSVVGPDELTGRLDGSLEKIVGDRHWHLMVVVDDDVVVPMLLFDHYLCHGAAAREVLFRLYDELFGVGADEVLPRLSEEQMGAYRRLQEIVAGRFARDQAWAAHKRLEMDAGPLRELARALALPFTEASMLWLARSVHDVAARDRTMEIISFRMVGEGCDSPDPSFGNRDLQAQLWEMLPDGFYSSVDPSLGLGGRDLDEFVEFYRRFPFKWGLARFMGWAIARGKREQRRQDREKLVLNNLGATRYPFHRTMFFDPFNDGDRFGLAFVDGWADRVTLQFAPPRTYLDTFDWSAFEERLKSNLTEMTENPRVCTRGEAAGPARS